MFLKDYDRRFTFCIANYVKNSIIFYHLYQLVIILCVYVVDFLFILNYTQRVIMIFIELRKQIVFISFLMMKINGGNFCRINLASNNRQISFSDVQYLVVVKILLFQIYCQCWYCLDLI